MLDKPYIAISALGTFSSAINSTCLAFDALSDTLSKASNSKASNKQALWKCPYCSSANQAKQAHCGEGKTWGCGATRADNAVSRDWTIAGAYNGKDVYIDDPHLPELQQHANFAPALGP